MAFRPEPGRTFESGSEPRVSGNLFAPVGEVLDELLGQIDEKPLPMEPFALDERLLWAVKNGLGRRKPLRRQRGLLLVARHDTSKALRALEEAAERRELTEEEQGAREALVVGMSLIDAALSEASAEAPAVAAN